MRVIKSISVIIIFLIILLTYFFGYNFDYGFTPGLYIIVITILLLSYMVLTVFSSKKIIGENPGYFFFNPWKKTKYIILVFLYVMLLGGFVLGSFFIPLELSKERKERILSSSQVRNIKDLYLGQTLFIV